MNISQGCLVLAFNRWHKWLNPHHIAIVHGDEVIEASGFGQPKGVRLRSLMDYMDEHPDMERLMPVYNTVTKRDLYMISEAV